MQAINTACTHWHSSGEFVVLQWTGFKSKQREWLRGGKDALGYIVCEFGCWAGEWVEHAESKICYRENWTRECCIDSHRQLNSLKWQAQLWRNTGTYVHNDWLAWVTRTWTTFTSGFNWLQVGLKIYTSKKLRIQTFWSLASRNSWEWSAESDTSHALTSHSTRLHLRPPLWG